MSTSIIKTTMFIIVLAFSGYGTIYGQQKKLDDYLHQALASNEGLQQKQFQLDKALYSLKEAKALFMPSVSLLGSYLKNAGGRAIDFPVGDLLNPVYSTLNQLTSSTNFPKLQNLSIPLNPDNFYDAKFRTVLPIINAEIWYNQKIKNQIINIQQATINVYKRQLVKDVKDAYYHCYQAGKEIEIYQNALKLVNENIRVNESLYRNGVKNGTSLTRAQSEKQKIETALTNATNNRKNALMYFNFLLNQPLDNEVFIDTIAINGIDMGNVTPGNDISKREELGQLRFTSNIYNLNKSLQNSHMIPKLNTFLDLGSQGFNWKVDNKSRYYMWGVNLQWDLFASNQYKYKAKQVDEDLKTVKSQEQETEKALQMQLQTAYNNFNSAFASCRNAQQQLALAEKYYTDQLKIYKEGQLLYIELLDAQNQLISIELQVSVAIANTRIAAAEIERSNASYPL